MGEPSNAQAGARRRFVPTVVTGLASAGLLALAGNRAWVRGEAQLAADEAAGYSSALSLDLEPGMPLAAALGLVLLAVWGVLLVTRGRVRRLMALVGLIAALAALATAVTGAVTLPGSLRDDFAAVSQGDLAVTVTGWLVGALIGSVLAVAATGAAVRWVPAWPEMGSRYDAPATGAPAPPVDVAEAGNLDLWRAIEEGHDPTAAEGDDPAERAD